MRYLIRNARPIETTINEIFVIFRLRKGPKIPLSKPKPSPPPARTASTTANGNKAPLRPTVDSSNKAITAPNATISE